jgi:hypothetical protein
MENAVLTKSAAIDLSDQLVGKPIVIYVGNKRREIGVIRSASYGDGDISIQGEVTDESVAGLLNGLVTQQTVSFEDPA